MQITLSPEMRRFVEAKLKAGGFSSPSEIVENALSSLQQQEKWTSADVRELRRELKIGIDQLDRGQSAEWDVAAIKNRLRRNIRQTRAK